MANSHAPRPSVNSTPQLHARRCPRIGRWVPPAVIVAVAAIVAAYYWLPSFLSSDTSAPAAPLREFTLAELAQYNGADPALPIYVSFDGSVHDVSSAPQFYGPQGSYKFFSGRDATRAYLTGCFEPDCLIPDLTDLTEAELATKENFESIYEEKYPRVGILKPEERKVKRIVLLLAQREEERQKKKNGVAQAQVEEKQGGTVYATTAE